jgi:hypothetical protein
MRLCLPFAYGQGELQTTNGTYRANTTSATHSCRQAGPPASSRLTGPWCGPSQLAQANRDQATANSMREQTGELPRWRLGSVNVGGGPVNIETAAVKSISRQRIDKAKVKCN